MRHSEQTSESHTLPPAELNPLINPILAENMGRWAEVYFTSPPETREQAVLELLRELEAEKSRRDAALASELAAQPPLMPCPNCGHDNPLNNKFCGMCGAPTTTDDKRTAERGPSHTFARETNPDQPREEPYREGSDFEAAPYDETPAPRHELSLFQAYRETDSDDAGEYWNYEPPASTSYRGYIGLVLAILIAGLGYMAWRQMQSSQNSHEIAPPPPAATQSAPAENQSSSPTKSEPQNSAPAASAAPTGTSTPGKKTAENSPPPLSSTPPENAAKTADSEPSPPPTPSKKSTEAAPTAETPVASDRWGAEELATAQRYLSGANGQRRDTAEASKWLWRSIAKHNGEATVLLADLYLRGDGVPKNCDQARVLLDSAARKGVHGAGERLRNLPAFGCQ
ncbi:MAG TPA: zinc-ribbon domain-containing protein [Candidatus Sulfotelmatobacter sp.]|nr:zinc-ribbon domain-containing protein [Candidatus Sulfotelmatobacter sp.]